MNRQPGERCKRYRVAPFPPALHGLPGPDCRPPWSSPVTACGEPAPPAKGLPALILLAAEGSGLSTIVQLY